MQSSSKLSDHILHRKSVIPPKICDGIVSDIEDRSWEKHSWYDKGSDSSYSEDTKELSVLMPQPDIQKIIHPFLFDSINYYKETESFENNANASVSFYQYSNLRLNKYEVGQMMRPHFDHIYSLFDGKSKGIPVTSVIINFNDDYTGGDLVFWDDYFVTLGKGDIIMFPSIYLYPHRVTEVQTGIRYSGVCWLW